MKNRRNEDIGFDPEWLLGQTFNVVCVGTHYGHHQPLRGLAEVRHNTHKSKNERFPYLVEWLKSGSSIGSHPYPLVYVDCGLGGSALVLGIRHIYHDPLYKPFRDVTWHLYTDTPYPRPDRMDEVITVQELRRRAIAAIRHHSWS